MRDKLQSRCTHHNRSSYSDFGNTISTGFYSNASGSSKVKVIDEVKLVRVNDYTKNISDFIFSPAYYKTP